MCQPRFFPSGSNRASCRPIMQSSQMTSRVEIHSKRFRCSDGCSTAVRSNRDLSLHLAVVAAVQFEGITFATRMADVGRNIPTNIESLRLSVDIPNSPYRFLTPVAIPEEVFDTIVNEIRLLNLGSTTGMFPAYEPTTQLVTVNEEIVSVQTLTALDSSRWLFLRAYR